MKTFLTILMGIISLMFLFFAGGAEKVAVAYVFFLLAVFSVLCASFIHFGNMELK